VFATGDEAAWTLFLLGLVASGLSGVQLVVSDAHRPGIRRHGNKTDRQADNKSPGISHDKVVGAWILTARVTVSASVIPG